VIEPESEPEPGSVIAIAAHFGEPSLKRLRKRSFCSAVPAEPTAAPPSSGIGVARYIPQSPQASFSTKTTDVTFPVRRFLSPASFAPMTGEFIAPPVIFKTSYIVVTYWSGFECSCSSTSRVNGRMWSLAICSTAAASCLNIS
jgi:hypothetical protein